MTPFLLMSSDWFVGQLVDVSLKSLLLATLAGVGMWVLGLWVRGVRSSSVQHRVWTAVLVGILSMPLLVAWTPAVPLPTWAYPDLQVVEVSEVLGIDEAPIAAAPSSEPVVAAELAMIEPAVITREAPATPDRIVATAPFEEAVEVPEHAAPSRGPWGLIVGAYLLGVVLLGARLLVGLVAARRLVRSARLIDGARLPSSAGPATPVYESTRVRVPITVGWLRPTIVLPQDWSTWDAGMLDAVLAHEQAHVRRGDLWIALLARVNSIAYWFHPLAWFLARRLTALAEAACDDAVIDSLGDRTGYARHLLSVATRLAGAPRRLEPVGVTMAARPAVEQRIEAILDDGRPLARRVGWLGTFLLLVAITPAILLAAGITAENVAQEVVAEQPVALASETGSLELLVVDENDMPVPDAEVTMRVRQVFMGSDAFTKHKTDAGGRLKIDVPSPTPNYLSAQVSTPGHAPYLAEWENHQTPDPIPAEYRLRLDRGQTIGGVVRDEHGKPIEGVKVSPQFNITLRPERTYQMGSGGSVKTNAEGEWTYASLPADLQQVPLTFSHASYIDERSSELASKLAVGPGKHASYVTTLRQGLPFGGRVTGADGKPIVGATATYFKDARYSGNSPMAKTDSDGRYRFTSGEAGEGLIHVSTNGLAPAMRLARVSKDMEAIDFRLTAGRELQVRVVGSDQEPLDDAYVALWNWDDQDVIGSIPGSRGKTDARGIWHWSHAPEGELRFAVSRKGFRYVPGEVLTPGARNLVVMTPETIEQARMLKFSGTVVDAETTAPIAQFRVTPGWERAAGGRTYWLSESQSKGRDGAYRRDFAPNDLVDDANVIVLRVEADGYAPQIVRTELSDGDSYKADFALAKAADESYEVLTPEGKPAAGAAVGIATPDLGPTIKDGMLADYSPCERAVSGEDGRVNISPQSGLFGLMVVHESGAAYASPGQLAQSQTIRLEPWARVEGTLRMGDKPAADEQVTLDLNGPEWGMPRLNYDYKAKTDSEGRFVFERVVPGSGNISRVLVTRLDGGMTRWTPTHTANATFVPGETTHVALGQAGRQIMGRLVLAADVKPGNNWRHAMVSLQSVPTNLPEKPKVPYPLSIDPEKDEDAARVWLNQWISTEAGKAFQEQVKRYAEAFNSFRPDHYRADVTADGGFRFEDLPAGRYQIDVQAYTESPTHPGMSGEMIASRMQEVDVAAVTEGAESKPVDLGELVLEAEE